MAKGTEPGQEKVQDKPVPQASVDVPAAAAMATREELVLRARVHCDGCGRKLRRSLQRLEGVGDVTVDSRTNTVVVSGSRAVDNAAEVVDVVERKTGQKAVLVSPSLENLPLSSAVKSGETNKKDDANKDISNELLLPEVADMKMVTVLKINLHCDACSEEIKRRILKITGVEEAVPHLKSSQMMVKGKVEPATLVGFIHKCTGRKAAIIRAEPLDLLQSPKSSPPMLAAPPPTEGDVAKKDDPSDHSGEKKRKNGRQNGEKEELHGENKGRGGELHDENPETEKPTSDGGGHGAAEEHGTHAHHGEGAPNDDEEKAGGDGLVLENHTKDDRLFTVPMPAGVVTVAPEMALNSRSYWYPPPYTYPYAAQYPYQYQYYPQAAYPAYACSSAMYGYGYPHYAPEAFSSEENPNACTIV